MGTTPALALPYPEINDPADGAGQMEALALAVEEVIEDVLPSRYQPIAGDNLWLPASALSAGSSGTPVLAGVGAIGVGWLLDSAASEAVHGSVELPSWWTTFDVDLYWTNVGAGSGNVRFNFYRYLVADAGDLAAGFSEAFLTVAAPAQTILKVSTLFSGLSAGAGIWQILLYRLGGDGADTLGNDMAVLGLNLRRAT